MHYPTTFISSVGFLLFLLCASGWEMPRFVPVDPPGWSDQQFAKKKFLTESRERAQREGQGERRRAVEVFYDAERDLYLWMTTTAASAKSQRKPMDMMDLIQEDASRRRRLVGRRSF
eukprot:GHVS01024650.1.p1 GENE.GHVS01024650.1~~GHVS01024650.1.p1  ORF type:complete len:117 (+),score=22.06 GHVS01024650.1:202-552(+)